MTRPQNKEAMWEHVNAAWENIPQETLSSLVSLMLSRMQAVVEALDGSGLQIVNQFIL
jgi:hypothetical protein